MSNQIYFRGTSEGYPGGRVAQRIGITPATTDPLVATIFATESQNYGQGIVLIATEADLTGVKITEGNVLASLEAEVGVQIVPLDFAARASITITAQDARHLVTQMGFTIPSIITDYDSLSIALRNTPRLNPKQIQRFVQKALELSR